MNMSERFASLRPIAASDARDKMEVLTGTLTSAKENLVHVLSDLDRNVRNTLKPLEPMLHRRRPLALMGVSGLTLLLAGGALMGNAARLARQRRRGAARIAEKARRLGMAVTRVLEDPDRVAPRGSGFSREVLGAVGAVVAATIAKRLIDRAI